MAPASVKIEPGAYLGLRGGSPYEQAAFANFLLKQPQHSAKVLPGGTAHAEIAGEATVPTTGGRKHVRLVMVFAGTNTTPNGVWLDDNGALFATDVQWFITIRPGADAALPVLRAIEVKYRNAQAEAIAKKVADAARGDRGDHETETCSTASPAQCGRARAS